MTGGYVKLFRSIESWEWYQDTNTKVLFLHCLIRANHKPKKWRGRTIDTGMFVTSYAKLSDELRLSVRQIRVAIDHLKMTGELTHQTTNEYSVITVVKWGDYQGQDDDDDKPNDKPSVTQTTTNKNDKKKRNIRINDNAVKDIPSTDEKKLIFGSQKNVKLTADQYRKLNIDYEGIDDIIEWFSQYIAEKGYKSKEHNLSIRRWVVEAYQKNPYAYHIPGATT